jgi:hypothetical protein
VSDPDAIKSFVGTIRALEQMRKERNAALAEVERLKAEAIANGVLIADLQTGLARALRQRIYAFRTIGQLRDARVAASGTRRVT